MEMGEERGRRKGNGKKEVPVEECYIKEVPLVVSNKVFFIHLSFCHTGLASWDFFGDVLVFKCIKNVVPQEKKFKNTVYNVTFVCITVLQGDFLETILHPWHINC